ncbi:hypothetical protein Tco_0506376 [Tanacetum coccineum]
MENEVKTLKNVDHSSAIHATIKSKVPTFVKEYLGTSLDDTLHKKPQKSAANIHKIKMEHATKQQESQYTIKSSDKATLKEFDHKRALFETMAASKTFNKHPKHKALYHALMESILTDEDAMDKDQRLKKRKTCKETEPSKKAKSTGTSKGITKSQPKSTGKSAQAKEAVFETADTQGAQNLGEDMSNTDEPPVVKADPKDWFKKPKRPPTLDPEWNESYKLLKGTCRSYIKLEYNMEECYKALNDQLDWNNPEGDRYPFDLSKPLPLIQSKNHQIVSVDYLFTDRTYTTSLTKTKSAKYDLQGIEDMNRLFNLKGEHCPLATNYVITRRIVLQKRVKRETGLMGVSHELYKFSDGTLISVRDKLKDMLNNLEMGYTSVMPRMRWSNLDKKWSCIMMEDIDRQLLKRRLMKSLEKFVGGRE